jgi:hypothetical protein
MRRRCGGAPRVIGLGWLAFSLVAVPIRARPIPPVLLDDRHEQWVVVAYDDSGDGIPKNFQIVNTSDPVWAQALRPYLEPAIARRPHVQIPLEVVQNDPARVRLLAPHPDLPPELGIGATSTLEPGGPGKHVHIYYRRSARGQALAQPGTFRIGLKRRDVPWATQVRDPLLAERQPDVVRWVVRVEVGPQGPGYTQVVYSPDPGWDGLALSFLQENLEVTYDGPDWPLVIYVKLIIHKTSAGGRASLGWLVHSTR